MVTSGMAKDWRKYSGRYYEKYQASAKKDAVGLWKR